MAQFVQDTFDFNYPIGSAGDIARSGPKVIDGKVCSSRKLVSVAITAANSDTYTLTINGTDFTYTADGSATTAEITVGLAALINAGSEPVVATGTDTPLLIESEIDAPFDADFTNTAVANRRITGDFSVTEAETNLGTPVVLVAQGQVVLAGLALCMDERSTDNEAARLPRQATDVTSFRFAGVSLRDIAKTEFSVGGKQAFHPSSMVPVLEFGFAYVEVEQAVAKGDQAYVRYASGAGGSQLGAWRADADSASAAAAPRCNYETAASAGGIAVLRVSR